MRQEVIKNISSYNQFQNVKLDFYHYHYNHYGININPLAILWISSSISLNYEYIEVINTLTYFILELPSKPIVD
jgi:hypothetical protein